MKSSMSFFYQMPLRGNDVGSMRMFLKWMQQGWR